ncbi:YheC/YheD family endospore coat-associated protein [Paenibacillus sp. y28]|uniref:YheC/YheD family endospore coat-associated protein n=1 Tax=Paenibacillus sp. y28 TaxID=3129110 RepID=UPI0030187948
MSFAKCTIRFTPETDKVLHISGSLLKALQLTSGKAVTLRLGTEETSATVKSMKRKEPIVYVPQTLRRVLRLPRSGNCLISCQNGKLLHIGPLVGVMASGTGGLTAPFGSKTGLVRAYLKPGNGRGYFFAFSPNDVDWQSETVQGYFPEPGGGWTRKTVPLPDAVYNRLGNRSAEKTSSMNQFKTRFTRRGIPLFNWSFFDKSDVYELLAGAEASKYVPESHSNPSPERIKEMLEKHRFVYLKPTAGSLGKGIYRLTYHPKRGYFARFRRGGKNVLLRFANFSLLMRLLRGSGRMTNYVVQQGIRLIEIDNCPIDFRFHLNKNGQNEWVVAGIGAKKAGKGSVTTHVKNGGSLMTPEQVLTRIYGSRADQVLSSTKAAAIKLAESIEGNYRHRLGELGFDIGIDQKERIWMFEANAKPGRAIFRHPALRAQGAASLNYIIDHCIYLSNFRRRREP